MNLHPPNPKKTHSTPPRRKGFNRIVENDLIRQVSYPEYRNKVRNVYAGSKGALLATCSFLSLHSPLGERMFKLRKFDLRGRTRILDVGSGAGQIAKHLLKYADPEAQLICVDLAPEMLSRARQRLKSARPRYAAADLCHLPFGDGTFDCVTCGYVLEHLPDARTGLAELHRVLTPGGRLFLLTTEDNFGGAWTSRFWCCRTYNRGELKHVCNEVGFEWKNELWYTPIHKLFRAGGICVELLKRT